MASLLNTVDDEALFDHCCALIATSLHDMVQSSDHAALYTNYKLAVDAEPYLAANRDANRPGIFSVRDRAKFNAVVEHLDSLLASSSGDVSLISTSAKAAYVALARQIYLRTPNAKADVLDEFPLPSSSSSSSSSCRDPLDVGPSVPILQESVVDESSVTARIKAVDVQHLEGRPAADFLTVDEASLTTLHYACDLEPSEAAKKVVRVVIGKLEELGKLAEVLEAKDGADSTALVTAMVAGNADAVKLLLTKGAKRGERSEWEDMCDDAECIKAWAE